MTLLVTHSPTTTTTTMTPLTTHSLDQNWNFRQTSSQDDFLPVAQFPTNIHLDLLHHGLIPDPFIGKNELAVQWVGETKWTYRTVFSTPAVPQGGAKTVLVFEGLDTFATVRVNGEAVLESDNMFLAARVDVTGKLVKEGEENEMVIEFDSAFLRGWQIVDENKGHKWGVWNGDVSRLAVRKAQYHWVCLRRRLPLT